MIASTHYGTPKSSPNAAGGLFQGPRALEQATGRRAEGCDAVHKSDCAGRLAKDDARKLATGHSEPATAARRPVLGGWVGRLNTFHTASMRAMVCSGAHSRSRITQLLRFMRPATQYDADPRVLPSP